MQSSRAPWCTSCQDSPPLVERQSPKCGAPGMSASTPPQQTFETPRTARPDAAKIVFESPGFTAIEPTARLLKLSRPSGPTQVLPAFVDL